MPVQCDLPPQPPAHAGLIWPACSAHAACATGHTCHALVRWPACKPITYILAPGRCRRARRSTCACPPARGLLTTLLHGSCQGWRRRGRQQEQQQHRRRRGQQAEYSQVRIKSAEARGRSKRSTCSPRSRTSQYAIKHIAARHCVLLLTRPHDLHVHCPSNPPSNSSIRSAPCTTHPCLPPPASNPSTHADPHSSPAPGPPPAFAPPIQVPRAHARSWCP